MNRVCDTCGRVGVHCPNCGGRTFYVLLGQLANATAIVDGKEVVTKHFKCRKCGAFSTVDDVVVNCHATQSVSQSSLRTAQKVAQATEIIEKTPGLAAYLAQAKKKRGVS